MFGDTFCNFGPFTLCQASQDGLHDSGHKVRATAPTPTATPTQHYQHRTSQWTMVQFYATKQRMYFCLYHTSTNTLAMVFTTEYWQRHSAVHGGTLSLWAVQSTALTNEPIFWIRKALYAMYNVVHGQCRSMMAILPSSNAISNRLVRKQVVLCRRHRSCAQWDSTLTNEMQ